MATIHHLYILLGAAHEETVEVTAVNAEHDLNAGFFQGSGGKLPAIHFGYLIHSPPIPRLTSNN